MYLLIKKNDKQLDPGKEATVAVVQSASLIQLLSIRWQVGLNSPRLTSPKVTVLCFPTLAATVPLRCLTLIDQHGL